MNKKDKEELYRLVLLIVGSPYHNKYTMGKEILEFIDNVDRGKRK